jgi:hypothetical protein
MSARSIRTNVMSDKRMAFGGEFQDFEKWPRQLRGLKTINFLKIPDFL